MGRMGSLGHWCSAAPCLHPDGGTITALAEANGCLGTRGSPAYPCLLHPARGTSGQERIPQRYGPLLQQRKQGARARAQPQQATPAGAAQRR